MKVEIAKVRSNKGGNGEGEKKQRWKPRSDREKERWGRFKLRVFIFHSAAAG